MDFSSLSFEELQNIDMDAALAMNPGDVETSNNTPEMTAIWAGSGVQMKAVERDGNPNMLRCEIEFTAREILAVGNPNTDPASLIGKKHTESFDVTTDMGLGMLVGLMCRIAGVDADDKEARGNLGGTVSEVVKELSSGKFAFKAKVAHRESKGKVYSGFTMKAADFAPA